MEGSLGAGAFVKVFPASVVRMISEQRVARQGAVPSSQ